MSDLQNIRDYRKAQTLKLVDQYKELIDKTWAVFDLDKLDEEIKKGDKAESTFLEKINKRRKGLDQVEQCLSKIESLESTLEDQEEAPQAQSSKKGSQYQHPTRRRAKA